MPSCGDKTLATIGGIIALPEINAAGAAVGAVGSSLLSIQHDNYDILLATKVGAAGSSLLSLALLGLLAFCSASFASFAARYALTASSRHSSDS
jgi:hypothetical protein